jgi:hypothetical protein
MNSRLPEILFSLLPSLWFTGSVGSPGQKAAATRRCTVFGLGRLPSVLQRFTRMYPCDPGEAFSTRPFFTNVLPQRPRPTLS